jgi:hypothetical protein
MARWLDRRARRRYARSFKDILAVRNDACGVAAQLREALPELEFGALAKLGYTSSVLASDRYDSGVSVPLTPYDDMRDAAAKLGGAEFWYHAPRAEGELGKVFTVIVVENPPVTLEPASVEVPSFITPGGRVHPVNPVAAVSGEQGEDAEVAEAEPPAERDCSE